MRIASLETCPVRSTWTWTECRQASFTFKKGRKFREWIVAREVLTWSNPKSFVQNVRMSEEVVEVLGFLAYEMVGALVTGMP